MQKEGLKNFVTELEKICADVTSNFTDKSRAIEQLLHAIVMQNTLADKLELNNFFGRLVYFQQKFQFSDELNKRITHFRGLIHYLNFTERTVNIGINVVVELLQKIYDFDVSSTQIKLPKLKENKKTAQTTLAQEQEKNMRVVIYSDDKINERFRGVLENTSEQVFVRYNVKDVNDKFVSTIRAIQKQNFYPFTLALIDSIVSDELLAMSNEPLLANSSSLLIANSSSLTTLTPRAFIFEPDFLVDVTAVAECFKSDNRTEPLRMFLSKFSERRNATPILMGNVANFFFDQIIADKDVTFEQTFLKIFALYPLQLVSFTDDDILKLRADAKRHWYNIKKCIDGQFSEQKYERTQCYIEPSFYSPQYGLQGRFDAYFLNEDGEDKSAIIELKSGKVYKPNPYGINNNHYTQTLLYDAIAESTVNKKNSVLNYILYSSESEHTLKFAPPQAHQQYLAFNVRNQLLLHEMSLRKLGKNYDADVCFFESRLNRLAQTAMGYEAEDVARIRKILFEKASVLEQKYFFAFMSFIFREHFGAKVGDGITDRSKGAASLWRNTDANKRDNFEALAYLQISENACDQSDPIITLDRTEQTALIANFRVGDIVVLYPNAHFNSRATMFGGSDKYLDLAAKHGGSTLHAALQQQIFKCTLVEINQNCIKVRLRHPQHNTTIFKKHPFWVIEGDHLDSMFSNMYRSIFSFLDANPKNKSLLLATLAPQQPETTLEVPHIPQMTDIQNAVFKRVVQSKDYFLLWGPPGSGKTNVMLKHLTDYFVRQQSETVLILAYTNRAVDEICEAIESLGDWIKPLYFRIGSRFSTPEKYVPQLLEQKIKDIGTRVALRAFFEAHSLIIGTLASVVGKPEIFELKNFDRIIVDEASQILEPQIVSILAKAKHFTLIGDHKQLPAIVQQDEKFTAISDADLNAIGLHNMHSSLFERLFKNAEIKNWTHVFAMLSEQGRMHTDIMAFPNAQFYGAQLSAISRHQSENLVGFKHLRSLESNKRVHFFDIKNPQGAYFSKINTAEADAVLELLKTHYEQFWKSRGWSVGIITPFRAQIATLTNRISEIGLNPSDFTIDTVERYQGSARDVIIISLCAQNTQQLESIISLDADGVDRKLNVALTRARQQIIMFGDADVLSDAPHYKKFIETYG